MAKTVRSNKAKGIKAKSQKDNKFDKLKLLSKYIVSGGNDRILESLLKADKQTLHNMKYRTSSQLVMYPKLISYINQYMNSLYDFGNIEPRVWFYSIMIICKLYGINHTSHLYYSKFQQVERDTFYKTFNAYYAETGSEKLNSAELNALFILYKYGFVPEERLTTMKEIVAGKVAKATTVVHEQNQFNIQSSVMSNVVAGPEIKLHTYDSLSPDIRQFTENVHAYMSNRNVCKQCEMDCRTAISIDTNAESAGQVDLMFIGFMPSVQDASNKLPFSGGNEGKLFHRFLQPLVERHKLKYVLTNFIFCPLDKTKKLDNKRKTIQNCAQLLDEIVRQFKPRLKIVVGLEATKVAGLKGGLTKLNGKLLDDIFVLMDPEMVIVNNKKLAQFEQGWINLEKYIQENSANMSTTIETTSFNIPEHQLIKSLTNDLTFFDSKVIKDKIIMIMLDTHGTKKYLIQDIQVPIFVKPGSYSECVNFSDSVSGVVYCSEQERQALNSKLYREINKSEGL